MPADDYERKYSEDEDVGQEADELSEQVERLLRNSIEIDVVRRVNAAIQSQLQNIDVRTFQSADLGNLRSAPVRSPVEAYARDGSEIAAREEAVQELLHANAIAPGDAAQERRSDWNTSRYLALLGMVGWMVTGIVYSAVARSSSGQSDDDIPLSDDLKAQIRQLVAAWQGQSDTAFWNSMASYVQANRFTFADLVYFMQYTMDLNPLKAPFFWDHASDPDTLAGALQGLYTEGGSAAVLRALPGVQYRGESLPRYEQAFVGRTAFAALALSRPARSTALRSPRALPIVLYAEGGGIEDYVAEHAAQPDAVVIPLGTRVPVQLPRVGHLPIGTGADLRLPLTLLPGEMLKAHALVRLTAPWRGFNEGTAVHLIHTSRAVLACPVTDSGTRRHGEPGQSGNS